MSAKSARILKIVFRQFSAKHDRLDNSALVFGYVHVKIFQILVIYFLCKLSSVGI